MSKSKLTMLSICGVATALVAVMTMAVSIPLPAGQGYINFGDTVIFITSGLFGGVVGMTVGGIGSALADLLLGYGQFAPFTLIIKGFEGLVFGLMVKGLTNGKIGEKLSGVLSLVVASLVMCIGYAITNIILYGGIAVGIASIPANLIQGAVSSIIAYIVLYVLNIKKKISSRK